MKKQMRVDTTPAHIGKRQTVNTPYIEAIAGIWLDEQPVEVKQVLSKYMLKRLGMKNL